MFLLKLALSNFLSRRIRLFLTIAAVALSVSLVVSVTTGYRSVESAASRFLNSFLGSTDVVITRPNDPKRGIPQSLVEDLRKDPNVKRAWGRVETENVLIDTAGKVVPGRAAVLTGVVRGDDETIDHLNMTEGKWWDAGEDNAVVMDQGAREKLKVNLGDTIELPRTSGKLKLKVVGFVRKPGIFAAHIQTLYVPLTTLQPFVFPESPNQLNRVSAEFIPQTDADAFTARWQKRLADSDPMLKLKLARDARKQLDQNLQGLAVLSYMGGAVSLLAAVFIVFSTLSMGVSERQRTLAMLRAIGAYKYQVGILVLLEGILLSSIGVLIGVPLGLLYIFILTRWYPSLFSAGMTVDVIGVLIGGGGAILASLGASLMPAISAMRVSPLEAMVPLSQVPSTRAPLRVAFIGACLVSLDAILLHSPIQEWLSAIGLTAIAPYGREISFYGHFTVGLPCMLLGFFLMSPLFVWLTEALIGPLVAAALGIRIALLRQQLTGGLWRAAGTCSALMVGLSVLVVMQVQGNSALGAWKLPNKFPDVFIYAVGNPLAPADIATVATADGIKAGETMPIAVFAPQFGSSIAGILGTAIMPEATLFFGVDPHQAFKMMELDFRDGNPADAERMLAQGRHLLITEEFRKLKGFKTGDPFELKSLFAGSKTYTVAGVVWSPGIDVMVNTFDLGTQFEQRTAFSVFGTLDDAKKDFGVETVWIIAANLETGLDKGVLVERLTKELGDKGFQVADIRALKYAIVEGFGNLLLVASTVAWAAMAVASLGVTNAIMASVRSRRWQFGILRSIGVTRSGLLRLVLAEALLLGIIGCLLGLAAGFNMAMNARQLGTLAIGFRPDITVPWGIISLGTAIIIAISLVASLIPAIGVAKAEPLTLLQAGRASA